MKPNKEPPKTAYDALLKVSWREQIPDHILREDTYALLEEFGANASKCDIYISHDIRGSYVKIMPNRSLDDFSPEELAAFGRIADAIQTRLPS
jgi:hypothetical protein